MEENNRFALIQLLLLLAFYLLFRALGLPDEDIINDRGYRSGNSIGASR